MEWLKIKMFDNSIKNRMFCELKQNHHPYNFCLYFLGLKKTIVINNKVYLKFLTRRNIWLFATYDLFTLLMYFNLELDWRGLN